MPWCLLESESMVKSKELDGKSRQVKKLRDLTLSAL